MNYITLPINSYCWFNVTEVSFLGKFYTVFLVAYYRIQKWETLERRGSMTYDKDPGRDLDPECYFCMVGASAH